MNDKKKKSKKPINHEIKSEKSSDAKNMDASQPVAMKSTETDNKNNKKDEKSNSWKNYVIALVIIAVIAVVAIVLFSGKTRPVNSQVDLNSFTYNNYHFQKTQDGFWAVSMRTAFGDQQVLFYYNPLQLENYSYSPIINNYLKAVQENHGTVYVSFRPEIATKGNSGPAAVAGVEVAKISSKVLGMKTKSAFTAPIDGENLTVFNCDNATSENFVVEIGLANRTEINMPKKYCVTLLGSAVNDTIKLADLFAYKSTGVMTVK